MVPCNPKNKSDMNRLKMGIKNTIHRLEKPLLDNKAIAVMGVKLGGCGKNLDKIAIKMSKTTKTFLLIIKNGLIKIENNILFGEIHFSTSIQIVKFVFLEAINK